MVTEVVSLWRVSVSGPVWSGVVVVVLGGARGKVRSMTGVGLTGVTVMVLAGVLAASVVEAGGDELPRASGPPGR